MQTQVRYRGTVITLQQVLDEMRWYDREYPHNDYCEPPAKKPWQENRAYKFAIIRAGRRYPPKLLAHRLTGLDLQGHGLIGGQVNRIFRQLGFEVERIRD